MRRVLAALALIWAAMLALGGGTADRALLLPIQAGAHPGIATAAHWLTLAGSGTILLPLAALAALWLVLRRDLRAALLLAAIVLSARLLVVAQKGLTARARPEPHLHLVDVSSASFPSAHAANSAATLLCLALLLPRETRPMAIGLALAFSVAIGLSRLVLGVHWPSDVVGGWAFGLFWTLACLTLARRRLSLS